MDHGGTYRELIAPACRPNGPVSAQVNAIGRNTGAIAPTSISCGIPGTFPNVNYTHETSVINAAIQSELAGAQKTQRDLAEFLKISESAISRRINGNYDWSLRDLTKIGQWLDVNLVRIADQNLVIRETS